MSTLSQSQVILYGRYRLQLYRMLLRASEEQSGVLPTAAARAFLRDQTRAAFRRHRYVNNAQEAENLLQRAHSVLLAVTQQEI